MQIIGTQINYKAAGEGLQFVDAPEFLGYADFTRDAQLKMYAGSSQEEPEISILEFVMFGRHQAVRLFNDMQECGMSVEMDKQRHYTDLNLIEYTIRLIHSWEKEQD